MRRVGQKHADRVSRVHRPARNDNAHDACFTNRPSLLVTIERRRHQPRQEAVHLHAGNTQSGNFHNRRRPQLQPRSDGQVQQSADRAS